MNIFGFLGRSRAFEARLEQSRPRLYRLAHSWCKNGALADDVVQESLSRALAQAHQLRDLEALHGWLLAIMANCWKDHYRQCKASENIEDLEEHLLAEDDTPEDDYEQNQMVRRVRQAVRRLPMGQRQVVTLVDLEECPYAEVAEILEVPIGTVMSRLSRARGALRDLLLEYRQPAGEEARQKLARIK